MAICCHWRTPRRAPNAFPIYCTRHVGPIKLCLATLPRRRAEQQLQQWEKTGQDVLAVWDESVLEKPESETLEGCVRCVRSVGGTLEVYLGLASTTGRGDDRCLHPACSGWGFPSAAWLQGAVWRPRRAGGRGAGAEVSDLGAEKKSGTGPTT